VASARAFVRQQSSQTRLFPGLATMPGGVRSICSRRKERKAGRTLASRTHSSERTKTPSPRERETQRRVRAAATGWTRRMRRLHKTAHRVVKREMNWRAPLNHAVIKNTPFLTAEKKRRSFGNGGNENLSPPPPRAV
jgi:hypothetical protein